MIVTDLLRHAIDTATRLHEGQHRKDRAGTPVISHPYGVAMILAQYPDVPEAVIIAGLLHDVLEDIDSDVYNAKVMSADFGHEVTEIVRGVTEDITIPDWRARKQAYLQNLDGAAAEVLMVSAADMVHNTRSYIDEYRRDPEFIQSKFTGGLADAKWFYGERAGLIHAQLDHPLAELALAAYQDFEAL